MPVYADLSITTAVFEQAKSRTFNEVNFTEDNKFNDYCGDPVYTLVGGDTAYLTFDSATRTIEVYTDNRALGQPGSVTYPHQIRIGLSNPDFATVETFVNFDIVIKDCPTSLVLTPNFDFTN